ncbi:hypothetical protein AX774_g4273 [Zancudomyces culisetae]|uniref:Uncharacterized protein n=1 Tax=Zancudomyces culisetae TaxID=1213189 RepID=A0A1R1PMQ5_ZANCU|nr:hypothetical protein AX774_g4273 [Zancudomyces culisetae]|eukprot:OMH82255.1 hypothetical protein AX774_g4273 [Zancudomyces culisetae]
MTALNFTNRISTTNNGIPIILTESSLDPFDINFYADQHQSTTTIYKISTVLRPNSRMKWLFFSGWRTIRLEKALKLHVYFAVWFTVWCVIHSGLGAYLFYQSRLTKVDLYGGSENQTSHTGSGTSSTTYKTFTDNQSTYLHSLSRTRASSTIGTSSKLNPISVADKNSVAHSSSIIHSTSYLHSILEPSFSTVFFKEVPTLPHGKYLYIVTKSVDSIEESIDDQDTVISRSQRSGVDSTFKAASSPTNDSTATLHITTSKVTKAAAKNETNGVEELNVVYTGKNNKERKEDDDWMYFMFYTGAIDIAFLLW